MRIKREQRKEIYQAVKQKSWRLRLRVKSLCKDSRFKPFYGYAVNRWIEYVGVKFIGKARIAMTKCWYNTSVRFSRNIGMVLSILSKRFCLSLVNLGQWWKKWLNVSISKPQIQIGLSVSKKLCLILGSLKWVRPSRRQVRKISPFGLLKLKTLLLWGLIKFKIFFLKVEDEWEL